MVSDYFKKHICHELVKRDFPLVLEAVANATPDSKGLITLDSLLTEELLEKVSPYFDEDQILNTCIKPSFQKRLDDWHFEKNFGSMLHLAELYSEKIASFEKKIKAIDEKVAEETQKFTHSREGHLSLEKLIKLIEDSEEQISALQKAKKAFEYELAFLQKLYEESVINFLKQPRVKIYSSLGRALVTVYASVIPEE